MAVRNVLIVQFRVEDGDTLEFFQGIEDVLYQAFQQNCFAIVDGHDYGQGVFNIYIYPRRAWGPVVERVHAFLRLKGWLARATIAKRLSSERLTVIWPNDFNGEFRL